MDLEQTFVLLQKALDVIQEVVSVHGRVLFVGTKVQAAEMIKEAAEKCGQYYVNHRWLGGMLTNWKTINQSIKRLQAIENTIANPGGLTKKEILKLDRTRTKLELSIGGIRNLGGLPDLLVVIDSIREAIAVKEAVKLGIPVVAILDSNSCPDGIAYPVPGNDDAAKSIALYCDLFSDAVLSGLQKGMAKSGIDVGASSEISGDFADRVSPLLQTDESGGADDPKKVDGRKKISERREAKTDV
jgi:small subunit ribosomal protein S2